MTPAQIHWLLTEAIHDAEEQRELNACQCEDDGDDDYRLAQICGCGHRCSELAHWALEDFGGAP